MPGRTFADQRAQPYSSCFPVRQVNRLCSTGSPSTLLSANLPLVLTPLNIEQQNKEPQNHEVLTSSFDIPCSIFCGLKNGGGFCRLAPIAETLRTAVRADFLDNPVIPPHISRLLVRLDLLVGNYGTIVIIALHE